MYLEYYGLRDLPFRLTPDPHFYYASRGHNRALSYLTYGLHQAEGFMVVTGEVGAGKTIVVDRLLAGLKESERIVSQISTSNLEPDDLLRVVASGFGVAEPGEGKGALLDTLERTLTMHSRGGARPLIVVDEAQNLPLRSIEELRMLSNFKLDHGPVVQTLLVGQPQLRRVMADPEMAQLTQRVIAMCHLRPLGEDETKAYVEHRLKQAGWTGVPTVSDEVYASVHRLGGGIPRRINLLMDRLFILGFVEERRDLDAELLDTVLQEMREEGLLSLPPIIAPESVGQ